MEGSGWRVFGAVFLAVLGVFGAGYCVLQTYTPPASATAPLTPEVRQFGVYMQAFEVGDDTLHHWIPATMVVNAGDTVILRITNTDADSTHGFGLAAFDVNVAAIDPGQSVTVRFVALRPGIYHYGCTRASCAADHGDQTGQLIVLGGR